VRDSSRGQSSPLGALDHDVRPLVTFGALTGWRKGEIVGMKWSQVDFDAGVVRLAPGTTKNGEGREFPFRALPPLAELLERQRDHTRALEKKQGRIIPHVWRPGGRGSGRRRLPRCPMPCSMISGGRPSGIWSERGLAVRWP